MRGHPSYHRLEQCRYPDLSDRDFDGTKQVQRNCAVDSFVMNGFVCIPKCRQDGCLVEEYLTQSHCYLPSMCYCKLLENIVWHHDITTSRRSACFARVELVFIVVVRSRQRGYFLTKLFILFWLRDHRQDGDVAVRGTGNLVR